MEEESLYLAFTVRTALIDDECEFEGWNYTAAAS